jgi:hypothetical protein
MSVKLTRESAFQRMFGVYFLKAKCSCCGWKKYALEPAAEETLLKEAEIHDLECR